MTDAFKRVRWRAYAMKTAREGEGTGVPAAVAADEGEGRLEQTKREVMKPAAF